MCGIVGYIGHKNAQNILITGLKRLEYRGYDSAGIVTLNKKATKTTLLRAKGKVAELEEKVNAHHTNDTVGIGHTRWATHGEPSKRNAHPHQVGRISVVHNGIIENYLDLKTMLKKHDYEFKSDTDSEVLSALIDYTYKDTHNLLEAVRGALQTVVGAYGIAVISDEVPNEIVIARKGSPLVVGIGESETFIASDASAIVGYTDNVVYLHDGEIGRCTIDGVQLFDADSNQVDSVIEKLEVDLQSIQKKGYDHFLLKEIFDQPESLRATLSGRVNEKTGVVKLGGLNMSDEELRDVKNIIIVGCGTAYYAGMMASYFIEQVTSDISVQVEIASEYRYRSFHVPEGSVALIVSQSGETADTLACLNELKRRGVRTLGIVNVVGSTIAREVDGGVYLHVGAEISVASTKAFTSQTAAITMFGLMVAQAKGLSAKDMRGIAQELAQLPGEIESLLETLPNDMKKIAKQYKRYDHALYVGRDTMFPIALEGALKLKEVSYVHAEGYAAGELKHGPIALIDDRFFEVFYLQDNWLYEKSQSNLIEMNARGAHCVVITDTDRKVAAETVIRINTKLKLLAPLLFNIPSQLLAYYIASERGNDVDQPRNLAKSVTVE